MLIPRGVLSSMIRCAAMPLESDLYAPVKALLEEQGYVVKGEVRGCDVVAVRGGEPPVIVELKRTFGLGLVLQGVDRLAISDRVYLAIGQWPKRMKNVRKLCRRLGEHQRRVGDPNLGGSTTRVPMMTAYRQEALRCAELLASNGPMKLAALRMAAAAPRAATILQQDVYGWFERIERGIYTISPAGRRGL